MTRPDEVRWTNKLPALIAGVLLLGVGAFTALHGRTRAAVLAGLILVALGGGFVAYSMTIKEWCVVNPHSAFSSAFSPTLRGCLRMKGWYEF